jgi:hypothetical protein
VSRIKRVNLVFSQKKKKNQNSVLKKKSKDFSRVIILDFNRDTELTSPIFLRNPAGVR